MIYNKDAFLYKALKTRASGWRIYVSMNWVTIGSFKGLSTAWIQNNIQTNMTC